MTEGMIETIIVGFPNFLGLLLLSMALWNNNKSMHEIINKIIDNCIDDSDNDNDVK